MRKNWIFDALIALTLFVWLCGAGDILQRSADAAWIYGEYCDTAVWGPCPATAGGCTGCVGTGVTGSCSTGGVLCISGGCSGTVPPGCTCNGRAC